MTVGSIPFVEKAFNGNDYFLIVMIIVAYSFIFLIPKQFESRFTSFLLLFYGVVVSSLFDNTIGAVPFDYYDIMDGPKYTVMDLFVYLVYGPYGYLFIYVYEKFKVRGKRIIFYIILWAMIGIIFECINVKMGIFHYKNGYKLAYSIPIYLFVQSFLLLFYRYIKR